MGVLDGKAAIVTGSARGIGRATAELLAREGAQVLINDLDGDVAEQAAGEIQGETAVFAGDLTQDGVPDQLVQQAVDSFGKIDINARNPNTAANRRAMKGLNVSTIDQIPQHELDKVLWWSVHGFGSKPPPPPGPNASGRDTLDPDG